MSDRRAIDSYKKVKFAFLEKKKGPITEAMIIQTHNEDEEVDKKEDHMILEELSQKLETSVINI